MPIGYPTTPEINYGFGFSVGWKGWDLSAFFQGQDRVSFIINAGAIAPFTGYRNAMQAIADDHWSPNNPVSDTFWPRLSAGSNANNTQTSTWWLRNGRLVRLKTLEFGYSIEHSGILKKTPFQRCAASILVLEPVQDLEVRHVGSRDGAQWLGISAPAGVQHRSAINIIKNLHSNEDT